MKTSLAATLLVCSLTSFAQTEPGIFSIGGKDNSFAEFNRHYETGSKVLYQVGESSAGNWPYYQAGSFDSVVTRSTMQEDWVTAKPGPAAVPFR